MPELPLDKQIENKIISIEGLYQSLHEARLRNLSDPAQLQLLYSQLSAKQMQLAELQLLDLNQHNY